MHHYKLRSDCRLQGLRHGRPGRAARSPGKHDLQRYRRHAHRRRVRLSAQENRDRVVMKITDTGTGMKPEVKSRLFDPFFTTKGKAGTGMGLAVSFGIIRRHNGSIEVESEPGAGTTFLISSQKVAATAKAEGSVTPEESLRQRKTSARAGGGRRSGRARGVDKGARK